MILGKPGVTWARWVFVLWLAGPLGFEGSGIAQTETSAGCGCTLKDNLYTCDKAAFERVLAGAKTAGIETGPADAVAQQQLKKLVANLGKSVVPNQQHPDLTFLLVPFDQAGVQYTSDQTPVATLRVFAAKPDSAGRGDLVWAENLSGTVDLLPWFAAVNRVIAQFKSRFHVKG